MFLVGEDSTRIQGQVVYLGGDSRKHHRDSEEVQQGGEGTCEACVMSTLHHGSWRTLRASGNSGKGCRTCLAVTLPEGQGS